MFLILINRLTDAQPNRGAVNSSSWLMSEVANVQFGYAETDYFNDGRGRGGDKTQSKTSSVKNIIFNIRHALKYFSK